MRKIMTVIGTRPEIIKMSKIINSLDKNFDNILVHTGQNYDYELNEVFFKDLQVRKPNYFLDCDVSSVMSTVGDILVKIDNLITLEQPDAFLVYGDTNSCLSVIAAKRRRIPIFHFEAGNRCFDVRVPEEINRKIVDHTADVNFVLSEHARRYLEKEGFPPQYIFKTGSHMFEVISQHAQDIDQSKILEELNLKRNNYFLVSLHREENVDDDANLKKSLEALESLSTKKNKVTIISVHPRTRARIESLGIIVSERIILLKPFGFFDYCNLQKNAFCVISDSGTISEETSLLNLNSVMLRETHERPEGMDVGSVVCSSLTKRSLEHAVEVAVNTSPTNSISDYTNNTSEMITRVISSYIDIINRFTWKK